MSEKKWGILVDGKIEFVPLSRYAAGIMAVVDHSQSEAIEKGRKEAEERGRERVAAENRQRMLKGLPLKHYYPPKLKRPGTSPKVDAGAIRYYFEECKANLRALALPETDPNYETDYIPEHLENLEFIEKEVLGWERSENPVRRLEENMVSRRCTQASIASFVGAARRFMRHTDWQPQFTEREATSFMGTMAGFKDGTMHYYRSMLKTFYLAMNKPAPFHGQKIHSDDSEEVEAASFSAEQVREIIRLARKNGSAETQYYLALSTIFGFRRIELGRITQANFSWNGTGQVTSYMSMQTAKHGRKRVHQISAGLEPYLKPYHATPMPSWKMGTKFAQFCEEIGYKPPKGYSFHAIRHALVTGLIESGLDSLQVDRWFGWRSGRRGSPVMAAIYYSPEKLDEQVMANHPFLGAWC